MNKAEIEKILLHELENVRNNRQPQEGLQVREIDGEWTDALFSPNLLLDTKHVVHTTEYRIKPKTILVNGIEVPAPETKELNSGTTFYIPCIYNTGTPFQLSWHGGMQECEYLKMGIIYINKEDAIARAKAMLLTQEVE